jgi:hypothetical protein
LINNLHKAFNKAKKKFPVVINGFGCEKIEDFVYIGVDQSGFPAILFQINQLPHKFIPIQTRALSANIFTDCAINLGDNLLKGDFLCLSCTTQDVNLYDTFFRLIETYLLVEAYSSASALIDSLEKLVVLFQKLFDPPKNSIIGLFGELLVINESKNINEALKSWHSQSTDLMDFAWTGGRLEVKTTISQARSHDFSMEQLQPIANLSKYVASVNLQEVHDGISLVDLLNSVLAKIKSPVLINKIWEIVFDTLGQEFIRSDSRKFDYSTAKKSLKFFNAKSIPSPDFNLPTGVTSVRFIANLDSVKGLSEKDTRLLENVGFL